MPTVSQNRKIDSCTQSKENKPTQTGQVETPVPTITPHKEEICGTTQYESV